MLDCDFIFASQLCDIGRICTQHKIVFLVVISSQPPAILNCFWQTHLAILCPFCQIGGNFTRLNQCVIAFTIPDNYWVILKYQTLITCKWSKANGNFQLERKFVLCYCDTSLHMMHLFIHHPYCRNSIFMLQKHIVAWCKAHIRDNVFRAMQKTQTQKPSHVAQMCFVCLHAIKWFVSEWWKHHVDCVLNEHTVGCV